MQAVLAVGGCLCCGVVVLVLGGRVAAVLESLLLLSRNGFVRVAVVA